MMRTGTLRLVVLLVASFFLLISWGASAQDTPTPDPLLTPVPATEQPVVPIEPSLLPPPHTAYF
ncbi:MAG: hypothetical protein SF123_05960 [Chloroflexota bacterium]|nr:hypothetical protein [Chloroflexota bacterium]